jgi:hypothetical protein
MESVLRQLGGHPIRPAALYKELETGCFRAVPNNEEAARHFLKFFEETSEEGRKAIGLQTRKNFEKYFRWDMSAGKWAAIFDSFEEIPIERTWASPPKIHQPSPPLTKEQVNGSDPTQLARWLIVEVLGDVSKLNTFFESRLARDLTYRSSTSSTGGMYFNESSAAFEGINFRLHFDFDIAYNQLKAQCERRNAWEQRRVQVMQERRLLR